ncbi:RsbRD N-terminal domain-containing protein [Dehalobacterium formicoaceticum]|uniref:RsbRD N-terminal domain-containing protein n=1 Tax=Dehalobacterium formicoaceticum TaxID=51515 RepID=A0ABT1Y3Z7_9FIRM|nr:RsbRD N-terminal domain-containing protein [Dehalobacterium formicoaceticum]MCR6544870.1 RsbRD N-terminal domain-containing protein [Dehalobacterium formicoaceticum]
MKRQNLAEFFQEHKASLIESWFEAILNQYPQETVRIFRNKKNPFGNPVGYNLRQGVEGIVDWFTQKEKKEDVAVSLDKIIRIWAVQDFSPSQTLSFLKNFKHIVEKQMKDYYTHQEELWINWQEFAGQIDFLLLMSMDIYTECRENLYQIKVDQANRRVYALLRRSNALAEGLNSEEDYDDGASCAIKKKAVKGCKNEFTTQS